ncbi:Pilus assembly protein, ATPase of CpaF family [Friedmanniella luteola]|uniref:Pilus assembly protein, ATPase of CpaF family n=1 Tax=Friedmanniella luteola TaxID=546871 RepID=A0A1H1X086_9ACTN|nr:ATPase, T2SS/T4P/T4SS family [Friedmanniella luteola]SDT02076.1 Pilus assembly protein, ATPase of CpaF family [Friedmanniella luteola]
MTQLPSWAAPHAAVDTASGPGGVDWSMVAVLRAQASERLSAALGEDRTRLDRSAQQELGRAIILELLQAEAGDRLSAGEPAWPLAVQDRLGEAVFHALFGLGRLQPLVDDDRIENIIITGHDRVWLERTDGRTVAGEPVADSDAELVDFLVFLASRSEVNARPFSPAVPRLHLRLDGGARLAASAWVTPRPSVVIRRHRLQSVTLADLVHRGTLSAVAASFLAAAVKARLSIVVAGPQGAGKTTLVRALCAEIPPWEAIGTFETEYELHLHEMSDRHPIVHAWEARPGSGERGPDGRQAGEFTLDEALYDSFRFNLSRQIVGEVRGREILAMIKAMESGAGSISTTHARHGEAALRKLVTCAMEAGAHVTHDYATRAVAENIDLVVQLHLSTQPTGSGGFRRDRWLAEILAVTPGERDRGYATTHVFRPAAGQPAVAGVLPDEYRSLEQYGFDLPTFYAEAGGGTL